MSKYDESQIQEDEVVIDLGVLFSDMWRGFKKYWLPIILILLISTIGAMTLTMAFYTPMYKAEATFTVTPSSSDNYDDYTYNYNSSTASLMANTFPYIIESSLLQDIIKESLDVQEIDAEISAQAVENANMFSLSVVSKDGEWSYRVLTSVMENYPQVAKYVIGDSTMNLLSEPTVPQEPYNGMSYLKNGALGLIGGILVGGVILFIYAMSRKTIRKEEDVQEVLGQECLTALPQVYFKKSSNKSKLISIDDRRISAGFLESIRSLRLRLQRMDGVQTVMITSTMKGEGVSTVAMNLAYSLEMDRKRVVLIDADWKHPSLCKMTGTKTQGGLGEAIRQDKLNGYLTMIPKKNVALLASEKGEADPYKIINGEKLPHLLMRLRGIADYIIIDGGSCEDSENVRLADQCDAVVYVVRQDEANGAQILSAMETLSYSRTPVTGVVFNGIESGLGSYGSGYGYGKYGYGKYGYGRYGGGYGYGESKAK